MSTTTWPMTLMRLRVDITIYKLLLEDQESGNKHESEPRAPVNMKGIPQKRKT